MNEILEVQEHLQSQREQALERELALLERLTVASEKQVKELADIGHFLEMVAEALIRQ